jgi:multiple sugar transport system substrate-binding protein
MGSRRFVPTAAIVLSAVMVVATGGFTSAQDGGWAAFEESLRDKYVGKTLRIVTINDPFVPAMEETNQLFTELTGAEVIVDGYGYDAVYQDEQLACQQQSQTYDVIVFDVPWAQAFDGCTEYLNDRIAAGDPEVIAYDDYFEVMREAVEWDGNVIGLPFAPYFVLQHYNTEYFDILGLEPATTFDEWVANAEAANQSEPLPDVYGTITNNQAGSAVGQAFFEFIYNFEGGKPFESMHPGCAPNCYADMTPLFSSPQGIAVVELFKRILPYQPEGALNFAWTERQNYFNTGLIAFNNQWNVTTPSADDPETSTIVGNVGTAPFPHDSAELVTQVGGWSMAINRWAVDPEFSWDYLQWFTSPQINVEFAKRGGFPARESTLANEELNAQYPWYATLKEVIPTAFADCRPRNNESFNIINTLGTHISRALSGEATTEEAMQAADAEIGAMLEAAGYTVNLP